jgi:hypothetical protein
MLSAKLGVIFSGHLVGPLNFLRSRRLQSRPLLQMWKPGSISEPLRMLMDA